MVSKIGRTSVAPSCSIAKLVLDEGIKRMWAETIFVLSKKLAITIWSTLYEKWTYSLNLNLSHDMNTIYRLDLHTYNLKVNRVCESPKTSGGLANFSATIYQTRDSTPRTSTIEHIKINDADSLHMLLLSSCYSLEEWMSMFRSWRHLGSLPKKLGKIDRKSS